MQTLLKKIVSVRNFVGKTVLWLLGLLINISVFYPTLLYKFYLTDKPAEPINMNDILLVFLGLVFIIGGIYYNKVLDFLLGIAENVIPKRK